jgi:O-methyltransferase involved in polyketide biosynthesis
MNNVNKTLYIPLFGKALVSKKGIILEDKMAEKIWEAEGFELRGKAKSKWLAYYMGIRSAVFDAWVKEKMNEMPEATVLHIGCGMDSRICRAGNGGNLWFDVDFPEVISERGKYFEENDRYNMLAGDARDAKWLDSVPGDAAIVVMEGISMYMKHKEIQGLFKAISEKFEKVNILMDAYSVFAAKMSKFKNPINEVGVTEVFGIDDPEILVNDTSLSFVGEGEMTPAEFVCQLEGIERKIFSKLYAGKMAEKLYKLYEYRK